MDDNDRSRGVLTATDRAYISGEISYEHRQSTYDRRQTIYDRVYHALLDFSVLMESDEKIRDDILEATATMDDLTPALIDLIAFLYGLGENGSVEFGQLIESGIWEAYEKYHPDRELNSVTRPVVDYSNTEAVLDSALYNWQQGEPLSQPEVFALLRSGKLSDEETLELSQRIQQQGQGSMLKHRRESNASPAIGDSEFDVNSIEETLEDSKIDIVDYDELDRDREE